MPNGTYGGVRGKGAKAKTLAPRPTRFVFIGRRAKTLDFLVATILFDHHNNTDSARSIPFFPHIHGANIGIFSPAPPCATHF